MKIAIILPILFFIAFMSFVFFMMRMMLYEMSGWKSLASNYKTLKQPSDFPAKKLKISNTTIEGISFNNIIKFYKTQEGLLLRHSLMVGKRNYNIFLPWSEIVEVRARKIFFFNSMRLIIGNPFVTYIDLREKDFKKIKENIPVKVIAQQ